MKSLKNIFFASIFRVLLALSVALCFSSCTKDLDFVSEEEDTWAINFSTITLSSKASVTSSALQIEEFGVYAFEQVEGYDQTQLDMTRPYIDNQKVERLDAYSWTYSPKKYWSYDSQVPLFFFAYTPFVAEDEGLGYSITPYVDNEDIVLEVIVPTSSEDQFDLMIARNLSSRLEGEVDFSFSHQLSKIAFSVSGDSTLVIKGVAIKGVYNKAEMYVDAFELVKWRNYSSTNQYNKYTAKIYENLTPTSSGTFLTAEDGYLMMLPQSVPSSAELIITVENEFGNESDFTLSLADDNNTNWIENVQYTYQIVVSDSQVKFAQEKVVLDSWDRTHEYVFDTEGNLIAQVDEYIDLNVYNTYELLCEAIDVRYQAGVRDFKVLGAYFDGALGYDIYTEDEYPVTTSPFAMYAPEMNSIDLSQVKNFTYVPYSAFYPGLEDGADASDYLDNSKESFLTEIILSDAVINVGRFAFAMCDKLEAIPGEDTFMFIDDYAFVGCSALTKLNLTSAMVIGSKTFYYCASLESLSLPEANFINDDMIYRCSSLQRLELTYDLDIAIENFTVEDLYTGSGDESDDCIDFFNIAKGCDLVLDINKNPYSNYVFDFNEVVVSVSDNDTYFGYGYTCMYYYWRSITYVGDSSDDYNGNINLDDYNGSVTALSRDILFKYNNGVREFFVEGEYFDGAFGADDIFYNSVSPTSPFGLYAPEATCLDFSKVTGLTLMPSCAFFSSVTSSASNYTNNYLRTIVVPDCVTELRNFTFYTCGAVSEMEFVNVNTFGRGCFDSCLELNTLKILTSDDIVFNCEDSYFIGFYFSQKIDLYLHINKINEVEGNIWRTISWKSVNFVDDEGNVTTNDLNGYIDLDIYNTVELLEQTLALRAASGVVEFSVVGTYFEGCFGTDINPLEGEYQVSNPFIAQAPNIETLSINLSTYSYTYPQGVFMPVYGTESKLHTVNSSDYITTLPNYAFMNCVALESYSRGNLSILGDYAFYGCSSLKSVELYSASKFGDYVFWNCDNLESLSMTSVSNFTINPDAFISSSENCSLILGYAKMEGYYSSTARTPSVEAGEWLSRSWANIDYTDSMDKLISEYEYEDNTLVYNISNLWSSSSSILSSVVRINTVLGYTKIKITGSINDEMLGSGYDCLTTSAENTSSPFANNDVVGLVESVDLSEVGGLTYLPYGLFAPGYTESYSGVKRYSALKTVKLPENITELDINTFSGCTQLESVSDLSKCVLIGTNCFEDCESLTGELYLPKVTELGTISAENITQITLSTSFDINLWNEIIMDSSESVNITLVLHYNKCSDYGNKYSTPLALGRIWGGTIWKEIIYVDDAGVEVNPEGY
ncbi:MAG: leucine-rich repeat protein [Rikenellaceae bacterium]